MSKSIIEEGKRVLKIEANAISELYEKIDDDFAKAVNLILACKGKVIVTGMGKSGQVGRKISSTFSSTGTASMYLHPAESSHGDLGMIRESDLVIGISNGGESNEMIPILNFIARKGIPLIALTGKKESTLGKAGVVALDAGVKEEACPLGLAPTSSSTVTLALGDALAMAVLKERGFNEENYAEYHPGGKLGRKLLTRVKDIMHQQEALPIVLPSEPMAKVISLMTAKDVRGVAGVVDENNSLIGAVTDGDIRRRLEKSDQPFTETAKDLMSQNPKTIDCNELAEKALFLMEQFQIQTLFAVDKEASNPLKAVGLVHIQDLLTAQIR